VGTRDSRAQRHRSLLILNLLRGLSAGPPNFLTRKVRCCEPSTQNFRKKFLPESELYQVQMHSLPLGTAFLSQLPLRQVMLTDWPANGSIVLSSLGEPLRLPARCLQPSQLPRFFVFWWCTVVRRRR